MVDYKSHCSTYTLYVNYTSPFAQRVWITRNYKGLQGKIKLVGIDLENRPAWYKEKVYPGNKVPSLEHNGKVIGESLDLIKYLESNFEGPSLVPNDDPERKKFGEELLTYVVTFVGSLYHSLKGDTVKAADEQFDYLENALKKFDDGPYLLGQFSLVDIAYIPFVEQFQVFLSDVFKYDITAGRPKLAAFLEEINKIEAYKVTKADPKEIAAAYKKKFLQTTKASKTMSSSEVGLNRANEMAEASAICTATSGGVPGVSTYEGLLIRGLVTVSMKIS
ncbi:hypothetical protein C1H46_001302 [Malus baccata]|uniref:glutathione transferase n=1 Tax=Malus baccata TaxID=106549 RepID=A0A540NQA1_MALBA|nr:hypothetical protein C1H46_001302 [Malus baccata]